MSADDEKAVKAPPLPASSDANLALPSPYPFAAAPDIIRAHQKDAYFAGTLANDLADLVRRFAGGRRAHAWAAETRTAAELAYWGLTTGLGHRTLGEEYCDLVEVIPAAGASSVQLPSTVRRVAYVLATVLAPYAAGRTLPGVRRALRTALERRVAASEAAQKARATDQKATGPKKKGVGLRLRILLPVYRYLLTHLDALTSGTHARAATLALFYFYGAYYTLSTRLLGLRYVFTRRRAPPGGSASDDVVGYEVLGALLVLQLAVQGYLHVRDTLSGISASSSSSSSSSLSRTLGPVDVSLDHDYSYTANNELLLGSAAGPDGSSSSASAVAGSPAAIAAMTHTPAPPPLAGDKTGASGPRFDLRPATTMRWLSGRVQRQCTLCLEVLQDPAATPCGHVFCWQCIGDWVREKPECPLCRRNAQPQHILPLRAI